MFIFSLTNELIDKFVGITFNYGALMAWSSVRGCLDWSVVPLYLSCFAWTVVYDSIYAFQVTFLSGIIHSVMKYKKKAY